jgi:hypothetical protein
MYLRGTGLLIVISALYDFDALIFSFTALNAIHQPVLSGDPSGPPA